jgi:hypothetical protein
VGAEPLGAFWVGLVVVAVVSGLSAAAGVAGSTAHMRARVFGWAALAIPVAMLVAAGRRRVGSCRRGDPVLAVLGVLLALLALARMRVVLGTVLGVG